MTHIQSQIRLHVDSAAQNLIPWLAAWLDSTRLGSARDWWRGMWVPQCWHVWWLDADMACWLGAACVYWRHDYVMLMSSLSGSAMWVGSSGIRVGSAHPGEEDACDAWRASVRMGSLLAGAWRRVLPFSTFDFDAVFNSGFVFSSSTQWYGQNTILTTFIF
jgi:hypothetical protein